MDSNDARTDAPILDEESVDVSEFDPESLPLGTFAAFDVSDEPMWTTKEGETQIDADQKAAIRAMVEAAARADSVPHRIEVQGAWMLELLDRGLQRMRTTANGGWEPFYGSRTSSMGMYGAQQAGGYYDTNVIGEKNDTIVSFLASEIVNSTFFPEKPGDPDDETYADQANCLKHFNAEVNDYASLQAEIARFFCTDETALAYLMWYRKPKMALTLTQRQPRSRNARKSERLRRFMASYQEKFRSLPSPKPTGSTLSFRMRLTFHFPKPDAPG